MPIRKSRSIACVLAQMLAAVLCVFTAACPAAAADGARSRFSVPEPEDQDETAAPPLSERLEGLARESGGSFGIYLNVIETGEQAGYGEDEEFYAASCYKLFLVMYIYESAARGGIDLDRTITYEESDVEGEEGVIQNEPLGSAYTTRELCMYAIVYSDNVAARMLRRVYGYVPYRDYATSIGCTISGHYGENLTTAREMGILLMRVLQFASVNPLGQEVVSYLERSVQKWRIPAGLPDGVRVGNKTGDYLGFNNDIAVVLLEDLTYVLCVLSSGAAGDSVHVEASRLVYEDIMRRYYGEGSSATLTPLPSTQWYFAHAPTSAGTETWLCLTNGAAGTAIVTVKCMGDAGDPLESMLCIPSRSEMSLCLGQMFGTGHDFALSLKSGTPILAERVVYCDSSGDWLLVGSDEGLRCASTERCFCGTGSIDGMETWLYLFNPGTVDANCTIYAITGSRAAKVPAALPAQARSSLRLSDLGVEGASVALCVLANTPILAEEVARLK